LERERGRTHGWMQIAKSKKLEYVGLMEEKLQQMGKEFSDLRLKELVMKEKL